MQTTSTTKPGLSIALCPVSIGRKDLYIYTIHIIRCPKDCQRQRYVLEWARSNDFQSLRWLQVVVQERYINATISQERNFAHYTARSAIFATTSSSVTVFLPSPSEFTSSFSTFFSSPTSSFRSVLSESGVSSPSASPLSSSLIFLA